MTAPTTLPAEVQAIVRTLAHSGPSTLEDHPQSAITAAFAAGLIRVDGSNVSENVPEWPGLHWVTRYALIRPPASSWNQVYEEAHRPTLYGYRLEIS